MCSRKPRGRLLKQKSAPATMFVPFQSVFFFLFFLSEGFNRIGEFVFECLQVCSGLTACTFLFYFLNCL